MRIVVTGGAGFIGSHVVDQLLISGCEVSVLDDLSTGTLENLPLDKIAFTRGSIVDREVVQQCIAGADGVIHLAALVSVPKSIEQPLLSSAINITGTLHVLEAARDAGIDRVTLASSAAVYGRSTAPIQREVDPCLPVSPYGVEKLPDEGYARAFNESFQMSNVCFRFFNVFGPRQLPDHEYAAVLPKFLASAHAGTPLTIHGTGSQHRDFVYVQDVARLLVATATTGLIAQELVYNLAFGDVHSVRSIAEMALSITESQSELLFGAPRPGDITASEADGSRLRSLFPTFAPTPFASGVAATSAWLSEVLATK